MTRIAGQNSADLSKPASAWGGVDWYMLTGSVVLLVALRLHAFGAPLETDECNYAYIGERLLAGDRLYVDVWDHQPPGVFALTAAVGALFGFGPHVFRWLATAAAALTLVGLVAISRRHLGRGAGWLAAVLFALASSDPGVAGEGCNREVYMNALGVAAFYLVLRGYWWSLLLAGLSLGLSSLLKTIVAAQWLAMLLPIIFPMQATLVTQSEPWAQAQGPSPATRKQDANTSWRTTASKPDSLTAAIKHIFWFALGPLVVWAATFAYFAATQRLDTFVEAVFTYNLDYGQVTVSLWRKFAMFFQHGAVFVPLLGLWIAGTVGLLIPRWRVARRFSMTALAFAAGSLLAICLPGKFWPHYYLLLLPSVVLGAAAIYQRLSAWRVRQVYAGAVLLATLGGQVAFYLVVPAEQVGGRRYGPRMSWAREHGRRIAQVTEPEDYVYVNSIDTGMYYYSQRRCPTRYTLATVLAGEDDAARRRRQNLLEDLRRHPPRLILLVPGLPYIAELSQFIRERGYVMVGEDPPRMLVLCDPQRMIAEMDWSAQTPASVIRDRK